MELHPKGQPEPVRVHNFVIPELGKAVPYGVYDIADNVGWVNLGISHDTAVFSVESIRRRWCELGTVRYPTATRLLITADCGVSNGVRLRLWLRELQVLARRTQHIDHRLPSATRHQAPANGTGSSTLSRPLILARVTKESGAA